MKKINSLSYYVVLIVLFVVLKVAYTFSTTADLFFLLRPTSALIELLTGSNALFVQDFGYHFQDLNIVIDKSCSGFNFGLLCFMMLSFLALGYLEKPIKKILMIPLMMLLALGFTVLANTSRIYTSIILESKVQYFFDASSHIAHEMIGVASNLSFLILIYFLTEKIINSYSYAKLS